MKMLAWTGCVLALELHSAQCRAQSVDSNAARPTQVARDPRSSTFSLRGSGGVGFGGSGLGTRLGAATEFWVTKLLGVGVEGGSFRESSFLTFSGGSSTSALTLAPVLALRFAGPGQRGALVTTLGGGLADVRHTSLPGLCLDLFGGGGCGGGHTRKYLGISAAGAAGWLGHLGASPFELGAFGRLDVVADPSALVPADFLLSANVELGFGI